MSKRFRILPIVLTLTAVAAPALAQQTVGLLLNTPAAYPGYTLSNPLNAKTTYLLDMNGRPVNSWTSAYNAGLMGYLLPDGSLVRAANIGTAAMNPNFLPNNGGGGKIEQRDWNGNLTWTIDLSSDQVLQHHDLEPLPNGNLLAIEWEFHTSADAIANGRDPSALPDGKLWSEKIIEIDPTPPTGGTIVWEWRVWDHLVQDFSSSKLNFGVVADHPELVNLNPVGLGHAMDWLHVNCVKYNATLDQIIVSSRVYSEFWIIDHGTTTAEAASHSGGARGMGGDILYRWGNPQTYNRGTPADQKLFGQHDPKWNEPGVPGAGNVLVFNNGFGRGYSSLDELTPPLLPNGLYDMTSGQAYGPGALTWTYVANPPTSFYSNIISGDQRLPNGNTLAILGVQGNMIEVDTAGNTVWNYISPIGSAGTTAQGTAPTANSIFKVRRYPVNFPAFAGRTLVPGPELETFTAPKPAPDGTGGTTAMTASRVDATGTQISVGWDVTTCTSANYNLLYGRLINVASYQIDGSFCSIGTAGTATLTGFPSSNLFFLIVGEDPSSLYESSWGTDSLGRERHGVGASFQCGVTQKAESATCP